MYSRLCLRVFNTFFFLYFLFPFSFLFAQNKEIVYDNYVYEFQIRSVQLYSGDNELNYPILGITKAEQLTLEFDEFIKSPSRNLIVSVVHCEQDWSPSDIYTTDFFDGFTTEPINNFRLSSASRNPYVHYYHKFPSNGTFKMSGNYLMKVYRNDNEKELVLTRRFIVVEQSLNIQTDLGFTPNTGNRYEVQSVNFYIHRGNIEINDAFSPINVCLLQNFRWATMKKNIKPAYLLPEKNEYRFSSENDFSGGNEFRWFDIRNVIQRVNRSTLLTITDSGMYVRLNPDRPRTFRMYSTEPDFNGNFFTGSKQYPDQDLEADYVHVNLSLELNEPIADGNIYIVGAFTDWKTSNKFRMKYNSEEKKYENTLFIKQGVYNYIYVVSDKENSYNFDELRFEGSHFETENYYTILVYYKGPNDRATRIIGARHVNYYD